MTGTTQPVSCRLLAEKDIPRVLDLMEQAAFPVSGLVSRCLYSVLCGDALKADRLLIGVAECEEVVAGFLLVIIDWRVYWRSFLIRHPLFAIRMLGKRLLRCRRSHDSWQSLAPEQQERITRLLSPVPSGRNWQDSSASIAKGVFMQIDLSFRKRGVGVALYSFMFALLRSRGVTRCDAKVDLVNTAAIPLHPRVGYRLERTGNSLFATIDLENDQSHDI